MWRLKFLVLPIFVVAELCTLAICWCFALAGCTKVSRKLMIWAMGTFPDPAWYTAGRAKEVRF